MQATGATGLLETLESEAIYILREAVAQCERPILLFSGGKDSTLLAHLARRAFAPGAIPFPFLHIDSGHNFPETLRFRDRLVAELRVELIVRRVEETIREGRAKDEGGPNPRRNRLQSVTLADALAEFSWDCAIGGGRREEEKSRAKERVFSHRDRAGRWDPARQRPELWNLYNGMLLPGEHLRVFPLSNWTELDVWRYIAERRIELPSLYYAHQRPVLRRNGVLLAEGPWNRPVDGEVARSARVRFRTLGDMTCSGAVESEAQDASEVLEELLGTRRSERSARADDRLSRWSMEERKSEGYF
ncbi:MAG: sulfate adenylyltransferase subunit CysD [Spirochaetaceae bacterium]